MWEVWDNAANGNSYEQYEFEQYENEIAAYYLEREAQVSCFIAERLQSFYLVNPEIAAPSLRSLSQARELDSLEHPSASLVLAVSAIEVCLKMVFIKPVIYGYVHSDSLAEMTTNLVLSHGGFDKFRDLLIQVLSEVTVDLTTVKPNESNKPLWEQIVDLQRVRNGVVHRAELATKEKAAQAISIAACLLEEVFPLVLKNIELHLHDGMRICDDFHLEVEVPS